MSSPESFEPDAGMPARRPQSVTERSQHGFSLLELLVVVTIIGIMAGTALLSMGILGSDRESEREALRLSSLVELLREEALMQGRDFGVLFGEGGYRFYSYDYAGGAWLEPENDRLLREHTLPDELRLALVMEGRELRLAPRFDADVLEDPRPQVMIFSSGEITPFEGVIQREGTTTRFVVTTQLNGKVEITEDAF